MISGICPRPSYETGDVSWYSIRATHMLPGGTRAIIKTDKERVVKYRMVNLKDEKKETKTLRQGV